MNNLAELLKDQADACKKSGEKNGANPAVAEAFHVAFIVLSSIAAKIEIKDNEPVAGCGVGVDQPTKDASGGAAVQVGTGAVRANLYPPGAKFPARYDLLFRNGAGLRRLAETYGEGVAKYGPDNWMNGFPESVMVSHALEHFRLFMSGDTSEDHLAHAAWNILTLMWIQENKPELMDLTKPAQKP